MNEKEEKIYYDGKATALKEIITESQSKLKSHGINLKTSEEFAGERIEAIQILRRLCERNGDNNWDDDLHLADIIDKHLGKYLE